MDWVIPIIFLTDLFIFNYMFDIHNDNAQFKYK